MKHTSLLSLLVCSLFCSHSAIARDQKAQLLFLENKGQVANISGKPMPEILFTAHANGLKLFFEATKIHYQFENVKEPSNWNTPAAHPGQALKKYDQKAELFRLDMELVGANPHPLVLTEGKSDYFENYYLTHCPQGIKGVAAFEKIIYKEVYPHIDWVIYSKNDWMEYDFILHPGADPSQIKITYPNAREVKIIDGAAHIVTQLGQVIEAAPISFVQENNSIVSAQFSVANKSLTFQLGNYDKSKTLVIDPVLQWSSYYGGTADDFAYATCTNSLGYSFVSGKTQSTTGIANAGFQNSLGGMFDAFIVCYNQSGTRLWATYYGGADDDISFTCNAAPNGDVYMGGLTASTSGIASVSAFQTNFGGGLYDGFIAKITSNGTLSWSTYYGGNDDDVVYGVCVDATSNLYLTGTSLSANNIATSGVGMNSINQGGYTAYLAKFTASGSRLFGTYFGDGGDERALSCAVDSLGNPYIGGYIFGSVFMGIGGFQNNPGGSFDGFLTKFNNSGQVSWVTYYGGIDSDVGIAVAVDHQNNVYFGGRTATSSNGTIASGGAQNSFAGGFSDGFLVKFSDNGARLWGTYVGNATEDLVQGIAVDHSNIVSVCGTTYGSGNIALNAFQSTFGGGSQDAFVMSYGANGVHLFGSYLGGNGDEYANAICTDNSNNIIVCGETSSTNFPTAGSPIQATKGGSTDAFVSRIENPCAAVVAQFGYTGTPYACASNPLILNAVAGVGFQYQWLRNGLAIPGATTTSYQVNSGGSYQLQVNKNGNCPSTSTALVVDSIPPVVNICLVTVDSLSKFNLLIWEKPATAAIDSFRIYREDITNVYSYIKSVSYNAYSVFIDSNLLYANPNVSSKLYKISSVDACGNESAKSPFHHSIKLNDQANGNFDWNFYEVEGQSTPVLQYWLLRDSMSLGIWTPIAIVSGNINQISDPDYGLYPNSRYRIITNMGGLSCNPTQRVLAGFNSTRSNIKNKNISSAVPENTTSASFTISPNPANTVCSIRCTVPNNSISSIEIHDLKGQLVKTFPSPHAKNEFYVLDIADLSPAVYALQIKSNNNIFTRKLIKY